MSLLPPGSNVIITGGSFVQNNDATKELKPLYKMVAPNAILNSGGRADPVRCHPGTREEVIEKMEKRIADGGAGDHGVFWLSGPAGAGKSAIMQTVAERCIERKVPMVNFFFFRADGTRNHSAPVIATLLFQLFELFPALKPRVAAIAHENPVIFRQSMREQFSKLVDMPLQAIHQLSVENTPLVILVDGLDECSSGNGKEDQVSLLNIFHDISTRPVSPVVPAYVVLVASRTESHLTMAFRRIGWHPDSIHLDDSYRPSDDIRAFFRDKFSEIRRMHPLSDTLPPDWPSSSDIDALVEKSSGQFVYPATVARFISDSAASPKRSLEIVLGLRAPMRTSPFAALDSLYVYILSQAEDWSSVRDILASQTIFTSTTLWERRFMDIITYLGYTEDDILSSFSDLTAIIRFHAGDHQLTIYHASLNDFLLDKGRAGDFYIDISVVACRVAPSFLRQSVNRPTLHSSFNILKIVIEPDEQLSDFLNLFLPDPEPFQRTGTMDSSLLQEFIRTLARLYQSHDPVLFNNLSQRWEEWLSIVKRSSGASDNTNITEEPSLLQTIPTQPSPRQSSASLRRDLLEPSTDGDVAGKSSPVQPSPRLSTLSLPDDLSDLSTGRHITVKSNPTQAPAAASLPQAPQRPSTPLSRFFSKLKLRRNRHLKSKT